MAGALGFVLEGGETQDELDACAAAAVVWMLERGKATIIGGKEGIAIPSGIMFKGFPNK